MRTPMTSQNWWVWALSGLVAILFGLAAMFWPGPTLSVLFTLFGIFAIVYGITELIGAYRASKMHASMWMPLAIGLFSILAGLVTFFWPGITGIILLWIIALWAILVGVTEIISGIAARRWLLALLGTITLLFGLILLANPLASALDVVVLIGVFAIVRGVIQIVEAFKVPRTNPSSS